VDELKGVYIFAVKNLNIDGMEFATV